MSHRPQRPRLLVCPLTLFLDPLFPILAQNLLSQLAASTDALEITSLERVHDVVGNVLASFMQRSVVGKVIYDLMQNVKVPQQAPGLHIRHDEVGRIETIVSTLIRWVHTVLTKELVTRRLNVVVSDTSLAGVWGNDELDAPLAAKAAGQACT